MKKKFNKLLLIPIVLVIIVIISLVLIHSYNNNFRYEVYSTGELEYKFMDRGYYYEDLGGDVYHYVITSGEKSTGGYGIDIKSVTKDNDTVKVVVVETNPSGITTMAFTYPYVILELYEKPANIKIVNTDGESFDKLN